MSKITDGDYGDILIGEPGFVEWECNRCGARGTGIGKHVCGLTADDVRRIVREELAQWMASMPRSENP